MEKKRSVGITILSVLEILIGTIGVIYSIPRLDEVTICPEIIFFLILFLLMLIAGILTFFLKIAGWFFQLVLALMGILACIGAVVVAQIPNIVIGGSGFVHGEIPFIFSLPIFIAGILCFLLKIGGRFFRLVFLLMAIVGLIGLIYFGYRLSQMFGGDYLIGPLILGLLFVIPVSLILYINRPKVKEQFK